MHRPKFRKSDGRSDFAPGGRRWSADDVEYAAFLSSGELHPTCRRAAVLAVPEPSRGIHKQIATRPCRGLRRRSRGDEANLRLLPLEYATSSQHRTTLNGGAGTLGRSDDRGLRLQRIVDLAPHTLARAFAATMHPRSRTFGHSRECGVQADWRILKAQEKVDRACCCIRPSSQGANTPSRNPGSGGPPSAPTAGIITMRSSARPLPSASATALESPGWPFGTKSCG